MMKRIALILSTIIALCCALPAHAQFAEQATYAGASTGSLNAYAITIPNAASAADLLGVQLKFIPNFSNDGPATLTVNSTIGPWNIRKTSPGGPTPLTSGEIVNGQGVVGFWDGTEFLVTSFFNATPVSNVITPQGRITLTSGLPVLTGDVSAATSAYYTPYVGNTIAIYNGTAWTSYQFSELTLSIPSSRLANTIYDSCIFDDSGTLRFVMGPAWSVSTAGSGNRGTGAGTAQLTRVNGILVNAVQISAVNGGSTYTVPAEECTYVGSFFMDGTNGQVSFLSSYGQSRKIGFWNAYNRIPITLQMGDATASWSYSTGTWRESRGQTTNFIAVFSGLAEEQYKLTFDQLAASGGASGTQAVSFGINSTTTPTGLQGTSIVLGSQSIIMHATAILQPSLGINNVNALEYGNTAGSTFYGGSTQMMMTASWRY